MTNEYQQDDSVAILQFDDGKANVVGFALIEQINNLLDRAEKEAQAVVLCGREGMFSGGFDLKEIQKGPQAAAKLVGEGAAMLLRLFTHPQPVVAAITGHAIAAGAFTALASDTRYAAKGNYKCGLNETAIGMSLPVFGFELSKARLSPNYMTRAVTQAELFSPEEACLAGFYDQLFAPQDLREAAVKEAARLGEMPTQAYSDNKMGWRAPFAERIKASLR